ncbi:hypothetical protein [Streptomyces griseoluteus]
MTTTAQDVVAVKLERTFDAFDANKYFSNDPDAPGSLFFGQV